MRNYAKFVLIFGILMIAGIILFMVVSGDIGDTISVSDEKMLTLNDIVKDVEENMDSLGSLGEKDYGVDFIVLDSIGKELYKTPGADKKLARITRKNERLTVESAGKRRLLYKYVINDESVVGSVILLDSPEDGYAKIKHKLVVGMAIMALVFIIGAVIYGMYIDRSIIKPFKRMQSFAGKVAEGKLDEPLMMEQNNMFGAFSESFDIMREELAESRKREIALQRKEKELVASLSHDLKTPVTGIKLTSELLKAKMSAGIDPDDMNEKLDNIYKKADQIEVLVDDLFSTTLDDLGEFKVSCEDVEARRLLEIIRKHDDRELIVESEIPDVLINIDIKRMNQVLGNIIINSYKYANTKIDINAEVENSYLSLVIRDYGPGVPSDELDLITNKFYRGRDVEATEKEGSGLGLYISKTLMEKMNGGMDIENADPGLSIKLVMPLS